MLVPPGGCRPTCHPQEGCKAAVGNPDPPWDPTAPGVRSEGLGISTRSEVGMLFILPSFPSWVSPAQGCHRGDCSCDQVLTVPTA